MKRLNLIIHIVVIVAVAALFVFEFTSWGPQAPTAEKDSAQAQGEQPETASMQGDLRVAYVNIDTLLAGYQMYQDKRDEFAQEQSSTQAELKSRSQELKEKFGDDMKTPNELSVPQYEAFFLYKAAAEKVGSTDSAKVIEALDDVSYTGPRGAIQMNKSRHTPITMRLAQVQADGSIKILETFANVQPNDQCPQY